MTGMKPRPFFYKFVLVALIGTVALIARFPNTFAKQLSQQPVVPAATVDYYRDIQPILTTNCTKCHQGPAAPAELRLDSAAGLMKGGTSGPAINPGSAETSLLLSRVADTGTNRMPPGGNLNANEISLIRAWINQGAKASPAVDFTAQVEPIFKASCYTCHSGS